MIASGADEATAIVRDVTESKRAQQDAARDRGALARHPVQHGRLGVGGGRERRLHLQLGERGGAPGASRGRHPRQDPLRLHAARGGEKGRGDIRRHRRPKEGYQGPGELEHRQERRSGSACSPTACRSWTKRGTSRATAASTRTSPSASGRKRRSRIPSASSRSCWTRFPRPFSTRTRTSSISGGNKAFERYIGLEREQFIGKTVFDIAPADLAERYDRADRELLERRASKPTKAAVVYADGTRHDVIFNKAVFTDSEGHVAGLIGVILDISERKRAEEALRDERGPAIQRPADDPGRPLGV